jgi:hypothetical protein
MILIKENTKLADLISLGSNRKGPLFKVGSLSRALAEAHA